MAKAFNTLPKIIQNALFSDEYGRFISSIAARFNFSEEQKDIFYQLASDILYGQCAVSDLVKAVQERFEYAPEQAMLLAREIVCNMVLPFVSYFGDYSEYYRSLGGDPKEDVRQSPLTAAVLRQITEAVEGMLEDTPSVDWEKESVAMRELFARHLIELFTGPDGEHKVRLNDTIFALLRMYDSYNEKLLGALYENEQEIGVAQITLPDGTAQRPTVANWIKDFLGYSKGDISSIALAKYVSENKNARVLEAKDKDALRRLFETFIVLKNFPDSLDSIPEDQWKIIPYYHTEEATKIPKVSVIPSEARNPVVGEPVAIPPPSRGLRLDARDDVGAIAQRAGSGTDFAGAKTEPDTISDAVIQKSGVIFSDEIRERVKKIVETRVRNVRNDIDTRDRLTSAVADGGAGLAAEEADKILGEAKAAMKAVAEGKGEEYAKSSPTPFLPKMMIKEVDGVPMIVEKPAKNGKKQGELDSRLRGNDKEGARDDDKQTPERTGSGTDFAGAKTEPDPTPPSPSVPKHLEDAQEIPVTVKNQEQQMESGTDFAGTKTAPNPKANLSQAPFSPFSQTKPIPDVKQPQPPRLVGLTDELRALTIKDLRRISENAAQACQKIADKINALAKESLSRRAEAINALKESPLYSLYLEIGQLNFSQDMDTLAEERKATGKNYLTSGEFDALLDMNEKLRF